MYKLGTELSRRSDQGLQGRELIQEAEELVETVVRPAAIDLAAKLEKERKQFFYRILAPVKEIVKILIGKPSIDQQDLLTGALALGSESVMTGAEQMRTIQSLKQDAGIAYLVDLSKLAPNWSASKPKALALRTSKKRR